MHRARQSRGTSGSTSSNLGSSSSSNVYYSPESNILQNVYDINEIKPYNSYTKDEKGRNVELDFNTKIYYNLRLGNVPNSKIFFDDLRKVHRKTFSMGMFSNYNTDTIDILTEKMIANANDPSEEFGIFKEFEKYKKIEEDPNDKVQQQFRDYLNLNTNAINVKSFNENIKYYKVIKYNALNVNAQDGINMTNYMMNLIYDYDVLYVKKKPKIYCLVNDKKYNQKNQKFSKPAYYVLREDPTPLFGTNKSSEHPYKVIYTHLNQRIHTAKKHLCSLEQNPPNNDVVTVKDLMTYLDVTKNLQPTVPPQNPEKLRWSRYVVSFILESLFFKYTFDYFSLAVILNKFLFLRTEINLKVLEVRKQYVIDFYADFKNYYFMQTFILIQQPTMDIVQKTPIDYGIYHIEYTDCTKSFSRRKTADALEGWTGKKYGGNKVVFKAVLKSSKRKPEKQKNKGTKKRMKKHKSHTRRK